MSKIDATQILDNSKKNKRMSLLIEYSPAIVMVILLLFNMIFTPNFTSLNVVTNISIQMTAIMLIALGMTWVIASGGIDISVGSVMALSSMVSVKLLDFGLFTAIVGGILTGVIVGSIVGFLISKLDIQPIIITLPFMIGLRGLAQILNDSKILRFDNDMYAMLGRYKLFEVIPIQIPIMIVAITIIYIITSKTAFGRRIEAIGDNSKAARLSGINTVLVLIAVYATVGALSSMAGIIETARAYVSDANTMGKAIESDAIAAVAIGGTSMTGGRPNIFGTVFGAITMQIVTTMVVMNNVPFELALVFKALIIIIALYAQRMLHSRKGSML